MAKLILMTLPIGNMDDLSVRCILALKEGKHFFVEDTRVFRDRVSRAGIELKADTLLAFHDQDRSKVLKAITLLENGHDIYIASDAGSPLISDPAFPLVREVISAGYEIDSLPGPNSVVTALELSALPPHPFHFYGFLPKEKQKRNDIFADCGTLAGTHIFFESPHRVLETTDLLVKELPSVEVCLAKELTKTYQSLYRFKAQEWKDCKDTVVPKGEFVLLFHVKDGVKKADKKLFELAHEVLNKPNNKKLSKLLGEFLDMGSKEVYTILENNSKSKS